MGIVRNRSLIGSWQDLSLTTLTLLNSGRVGPGSQRARKEAEGAAALAQSVLTPQLGPQLRPAANKDARPLCKRTQPYQLNPTLTG